jgi:hypothetical protein
MTIDDALAEFDQKPEFLGEISEELEEACAIAAAEIRRMRGELRSLIVTINAANAPLMPGDLSFHLQLVLGDKP